MREFVKTLRMIMREEQAHAGEHTEMRAWSAVRTIQGVSGLVLAVFVAYELMFLAYNGYVDLRFSYLAPIAAIVAAGPAAWLLHKHGYIIFLCKYARISMHILMLALAFWLDCCEVTSLCIVYVPLFIAAGPIMLLQSTRTELIINTAALACYYLAAALNATPIAPDHAVVTGMVAYFFSLAALIIVAHSRFTIATTSRDLERAETTIRVGHEQHQVLQEALNAAQQASVAKTTFLNSVSHDIRTPMNAIVGFSSRAASNIDKPEIVKESLSHIDDASQQLLTYISSILEMTNAKSSRIGFMTSRFSLTELADELTDERKDAIQKKHQSFECDTKGVTDDLVSADRERLGKVLSILLDNSINYTPKGGHISLVIKQNERVNAKLVRYAFYVTDNGAGIPEECLDQVFDPFSRAYDTTHSGVPGTGLGLALAKSMVESSGGIIRLESKVGVGTKATVILPLDVNEREADHEDANSSAEEPDANGSTCQNASEIGTNRLDASPDKMKSNVPKESLAGARILVVDDNMINREVAADLLSEKGFAVDTAESGARALELFEASAPDYYTAILMDIMMPEMDGMETTRALRALDRDDAKTMLIVALSANVHSNDSEKAIAAGMNMFLPKPFQVDNFVHILNEML